MDARIILILTISASLYVGVSYAFLGGDTIQYSDKIKVTSSILQVPDNTLQEMNHHGRYLIFGDGTLDSLQSVSGQLRSASSDNGFFLVATLDHTNIPALEAQGYTIIPDMRLDLHSETLDSPKIRGAVEISSSQIANDEYGYTGKGLTIAVLDTGVDFSNPDIQHSVARDENNIPIMLDADGQGIVLTNATFVANIDEYGILRNYTAQKPENITSVIYRNSDGVFLDINQGGNGTTLSVYNSFFPQHGPDPVFNGTLFDDMKIGDDNRNYITSTSGVYRLGVIYQGSTSGSLIGVQSVPVLVVDSEVPGLYDTIVPDLSTAWKDFVKNDLPDVELDFDFTDETPIVLGSGDEFLLYDHDGDGRHDFSAGTVGARVVDVYGVISDKEALFYDSLNAVNGTLLPPMDPDGEFFGVMTDFIGHGTSSTASIASKGVLQYDIYNNTSKYVIRGVAPDASIIPVKSLWLGDSIYASLWAAGFDSTEDKWEFSGRTRADILSNSWGVSNFPLLNSAPGMDILSLVHGALATPRSLDSSYPGVVTVFSAGNSGHGYGTIGLPGASPFAISVGATTNNVFVGYGPFKDEPRFGNTTDHAGHVVDFSSRGPGIIGDPKPELMSVGAYGFASAHVTNTEPNSTREPFAMFGGTSMAAPVVSGSAAVVMQGLREDFRDYDPFEIKNILISSASDIRNDPFTQGAGLVNVDNAAKFIRGEPGYFVVHNDASYLNIKEILDAPMATVNSTAFGLEQFELPSKNYPQSTWFGGQLFPGERSSAKFTIENPSDKLLELTITPQKLNLIQRTSYQGSTIVQQTDPILNGSQVYAPNYVRLDDVKKFDDLHSYFASPTKIPDDSSLMILNVNFPFDEFMNQTDPVFANDMKISSLYLYDWSDINNDTSVSSDELSMITRGGSWGTVQELRVSDPDEQFNNTPLVGIYPVPSRYSYWLGDTTLNSTSIDYELSASHYKREKWDMIWLDRFLIEVPPYSKATVSATIIVPTDYQTGIYQGFLSFEGVEHSVSIPVTFAVKNSVKEDSLVLVRGQDNNDVLFGNGYIKGAFDMVNRYMSGDWRQFYFEIEDESINTGIVDISWEDPDTHLSVFAVDPYGRIVQTNVPSGVFGHFMDWPTSDWLGTTPFSEGGGFFPVKNKDNNSSGLYVPINQTGTYAILAHSGLFGGNNTTEDVSVAAKFVHIPQPNDVPDPGIEDMSAGPRSDVASIEPPRTISKPGIP